MSFKAYLDTIQSKTGKPAREIADQVRERGLAKPAEIIAWLKTEFGLGHGHAMAIVSLLRSDGQPAQSADDRIAGYFTGPRTAWRAAFDHLAAAAERFGPGVSPRSGRGVEQHGYAPHPDQRRGADRRRSGRVAEGGLRQGVTLCWRAVTSSAGARRPR